MSNWICGCGAQRLLIDRGRPFIGCALYPACQETAPGRPWSEALGVYASRAPRLANGRVVTGLDYGYTVCKLWRAATHKVMIVSYSIGDDGMVDALIKDAVTRGLDVEIWGGGAAVERAREVAALGARVWLPRPGKFIHAKAVVADGLVAVVGSANLAQTSMTRNMEAGVVSTKDVPRWSAEWRRELSMMSRPI